MTRSFKGALFVFLPLAMLAIAAVILITTPLGLQLGYKLLREEIPGEFHIESIAGSLLSTIQLDGLRYQDETLQITLDSLELEWQWQALLEDRIHIGDSTASNLAIEYTASSSDIDQDTATQLGPYLPENLIIDSLKLDIALYSQDDMQATLTESRLHIDQGTLDLTTGIQYQADTDQEAMSAHASIQLTQQAQSWQVNQLDLILPDNNQLKASGTIYYDSKLALQLEWQQLYWPSTEGETALPITLGVGSATLTGTFDALQFETESAFASEFVSGNLKTQGVLQGNQLDLYALAIATPSGSLNGTARLDFADQLNWQTTVDFTSLDTAVIDPQWPSNLAGKVTINGSYQEDRLQQNVQLHSLNGSLRDYPVAANGTFRHSDQHLSIRKLALRSGETKIAINGDINENWQTQWSVSSPDLAELWPEANGALKASGKLSGPRNHPLIETTFSGQDLQFERYAMQSISGDLHIDTGSNGEWYATAQANQLRAGEQQLEQADLLLQGHIHQHVLQLEMQHPGADVQLVAEGALVDQQWRGKISKADWQAEHLGKWQLQTPVAGVVIDQRQALLPTACWLRASAKLCTDLNYQQSDGWSVAFTGNQLPLASAKPWLPAQINIDGHASVTARLQAGPNSARPDNGQLTLTLSKGSVRYSEQEESEVDYKGGELALTLVQQTLSSKLALQINEHAELSGDFRITQLFAEKPQLSGQLYGSLDQLGVFEPFITQIDQLSGQLFVDIALQGNLYQPTAQGKLAITEARFVIPQTAVAYQAIEITVISDTQRRLNVSGSARSADKGELRVDGKLRLHEKKPWEMRLNVQGEQFLVSDTLETQLRINPDLKLQLQPYEIRLSGDLEIPQARLKPEDYQGVVTPSRDTEFVGKEKSTTQSRWQFYSLISISLGKDVFFQGYGLQGFFNGRVKIQDEPGLLTRGTGELAIRDGLYRAYGQDLDIEIGRLLFNNSPLDAPAIHLRAARTVGTVKAGLQADGPIRSPDISLYSSPAMSESNTLSYLLFGRPLNQSSESDTATLAKAASAIGLSGGGFFASEIGEQLGLDEVSVEGGETLEETALLVGKYLSPSLYLGYSVGLFEPINTVLLRYRINENWMIETETGVESGGDILYTIER